MEKQYDVVDNIRFNRTSHKAGGTLRADPSDVAELVEQGLLTESTKEKAVAGPTDTVVIAPGTNAETVTAPAAKKTPVKKTAAKKTTAKSK